MNQRTTKALRRLFRAMEALQSFSEPHITNTRKHVHDPKIPGISPFFYTTSTQRDPRRNAWKHMKRVRSGA